MKEKIRNWDFARKVKLFILLSIVSVASLVLLISMIMSFRDAYRSTVSLASEQLEFLSRNYESALDQYKSSCVAILMDSSVQAYLRGSSGDKAKDRAHQDAARGILKEIYIANNSINFIGLLNYNMDSYLYRGNAMTLPKFLNLGEEIYRESREGNGSSVRMSFGKQFSEKDENALTIFYPAYSSQNLDTVNGLICINIKDPLISEISSQKEKIGFSKLLLTGLDGTLMGAAKGEAGGKVEYVEELTGDQGNFQYHDQLIIYKRVGSWNYYLISVLPVSELYLSGYRTVLLVAVIVVVLLALFMMAVGKLFSMIYAPLNQMARDMSHVANGNMEIRVNTEHLGSDFEQMGDSFNQMMDRLSEAMEEIRIKQEQLAQTRLNALQSQIQPHFLYNTLECIHWQAVAEGNKEVSRLVKALAAYYRICLSKGKDVIPLSEELSQIQYYMIIQNMRFGNSIHLDIEVDDCYKRTRLPKLTLQPLVENAVEHGIGGKEDTEGTIRIWVERDKQDILLKVLNTGDSISAEKVEEINESLHESSSNLGYGVRNVNRRIELLFGAEYGLTYERNEYQAVTVTVRLPETNEEEQNV